MATADVQRVLKAESVRGLGSQVAFNYDDLQVRCETYLATVKQQAHEILVAAHAEAAQFKETARKEGYAEGQAIGKKDAAQEIEKKASQLADQRVQAKLAGALPALQQAAQSLTIERDKWLHEWQGAAVHLSLAIARRILQSELHARPEAAAAVVRQALDLAAGSAQIRLRLNPEDAAVIGPACREALQRVTAGGSTEIVPDKTVTRGGCLLETRHGVIDAQLETQLNRIAAELLDGE